MHLRPIIILVIFTCILLLSCSKNVNNTSEKKIQMSAAESAKRISELKLLGNSDESIKQQYKTLIRDGVDLNQIDLKGKLLLSRPIRYGYYEQVELLINAGASVTAKDADGHNALNHCLSWPPKSEFSNPEAYCEIEKITCLILEKGAIISPKGIRCLFHQRFNSVIKYLFEKGHLKFSPKLIEWAGESKNTQIKDFLRSKAPDKVQFDIDFAKAIKAFKAFEEDEFKAEVDEKEEMGVKPYYEPEISLDVTIPENEGEKTNK